MLERRIRKAEDRLDDLRADLSNWGFGMRPSERRWHCDQIEKAEAKLEALLARRPAAVPGETGKA